jgi:hypothetical protein
MVENITIWEKYGLIIKPQKRLWWMQTHAMVPTVGCIEGSLCRVYFSGRDNKNRSHIGYAVIDLDDLSKTPEYSREPVLSLGDLGCFDDNGVTPCWIINYGSKKYLYYVGWNRKSTVRMGLLTGLAISDDGGESFERVSRAPILDRTSDEPYSILTGPTILIENGLWRLWYVSCLGWVHEDLPMYNIKYAESRNGIEWERKGIVCIDFKSFDEHSLARPCVIKENNMYKMWYSYKGEHYRIGYAESDDGIRWERMDAKSGIDVSESQSDFDSVMIGLCYVFTYKGTKYMLYNGNNYGYGGVGLAFQRQ